MHSAPLEKRRKCRRPFLVDHVTSSLGAVVAASSLACLLLASVDLVALHVHPYHDGRPALFVLPALALFAGVFLGAIVWLTGALVYSVSGKQDFLLSSALVSAMAASPCCFLLARGLFSGAGVSRIISPAISIPAATLLLILIFGSAVFLGGWLYLRALYGKLDLVSWVLAIMGLFGFVVSLHWINGHVFVRLYPQIHKAQSWTAWGAGTFLFGILLAPAFREGRGKHILKAAGATVALGGVVGLFIARPAWMNHETRFILVDGTVTGREIVEILTRRKFRPDHFHVKKTNAEVWRQEIGGLPLRHGTSVLLITVDALRADMMGTYSPQSRLTPNLDRWAEKSTVFERSYCQSPHSSYSIAALLTGEPVRSLAALKHPMPMTLADLMNEKGYSTSAYCTDGVFYTGRGRLGVYRQNRFGFRDFDPNGYDGGRLTRLAKEELKRLQGAGNPFFLWVHYFDLHEPYRRHEEFDFGPAPLDRYKSEIAYTERYIADLISKADSLEKEVIVVLTADHGEEFGEHGGFYHGSSLYDEQVRVPLIINIPGVDPRMVRAPVSLVDLAPTLLDVLGVDIPHNLEGRSLVPYIAGKDPPPRPVFAEVSTKRMVLFEGVKLIKDTWRKTMELYDLEQDPMERRNLVESRPEQAAKLQNMLYEYMARLAARNRGLPEALAAARLGTDRARDGLCALVENESAEPDHRLEAVQRLSRMKGGCSFPVLSKMMQTRQPGLWEEAAISIGELEHPEAVDALKDIMIKADSPDLRHRAAIAAGRLKMKAAAPFLLEALFSSNGRTRYRSAHYLGQVGGDEAVRPLMHAAGSVDNVGHLIAVSLGRIGYRIEGNTSEEILDFLSDWAAREKSNHVLASIMKGIGYLGKKRSAKTLMHFLEDENIQEAREALVRTRAWGPEYGFWGTDFPPGDELSIAGAKRKDFDPGARIIPEAVVLSEKLKCGKNRTWKAFSFLNRSSCLLSPRFRVRFFYDPAERNTDPKHLLFTIRPKKDRNKSPMFLNLQINTRRLERKPLQNGWQELRWTLEDGSLQPGWNTVKAESQGTLALEADHLIAW